MLLFVVDSQPEFFEQIQNLSEFHSNVLPALITKVDTKLNVSFL